ncbi:MAG TPA: sigma-70 family RNA polymerase sigma factor [Kiritimatiellae bacterium]|nr:sigma-70 family RNA polymerase sigma factor [Kiritimatiellia bacterium]
MTGEAKSAAQDGEAALLARTRSGDRAACGELVRRYQSRIYSLVYNMVGNREDAEDLVQEIFVRAFHNIGSFQGRSRFYTWLYRIAVNLTINFLKRSARSRNLSLDDVELGIERDRTFVEVVSRRTPATDMRITELQERLNAALQKLSDKHRTVVVLHDIEGIPHQEIARMLRCSAGTVRSRLFYARKQLQEELRDLLE